MKVLSFNVRVWTRDLNPKKKERYWKNRMDAIRSFIRFKNPDIICFQELSYPATNYVPHSYERVGCTVSHPIYIRKDRFEVKKHIFRIHFDYVSLIDKTTNKEYDVFNVHSHWNKKTLEENLSNIGEMADVNKNTIMCGDWNNDFDTLNQYALFEDFPLINHGKITFEHFDKYQVNSVDFFATNVAENDEQYLFCDVPNRVKRGRYFPVTMSDHYPVVLDIRKKVYEQ